MSRYEWIKLLSSYQISEPSSPHVGLFPMTRTHVSGLYQRQDSCLFGSASIAYILLDLFPNFTHKEQHLVKKIYQNICAIYPVYQNALGRKTYNFWQTKPPTAFPNGYFLHRFTHFRLPDDLDDTALVVLTSEPDQNETYSLAQAFTGKYQKKKFPNIHNSYYAFLPDEDAIYQTWFGEKMPLEFDFCVLCNWMTYALRHVKTLQGSDLATLQFIQTQLRTGKWLSNPFDISRHYGTSYWITYYFARLYKAHPTYFSDNLVENIRDYCFSQIQTSTFHKMKDVIWLLAYLKLGGRWAKEVELSLSMHKEKFPVFLGAFLAPYTHRVPAVWVRAKGTRLEWISEALNLTFLLEANILLNTSVQSQQN